MHKKLKLVRIILTAVILIVCNVMSSFQVNAEYSMINQSNNRIVFVLDCSNSMNYNDKNKLANEMIKMFIDSTNSTNTDIGFIAYNDGILTSHSLTSMIDKTSRDELKNAVDNNIRIGSTDIGMALNKGVDLFAENPKDNSRPVIVLFSDGKTDLNSSKTGRTEADSQREELEAYEKAKILDCPIYTIGFSRNGKLNTDYLNKIATNTGGKRYAVQNSQDIENVFDSLFIDITKKQSTNVQNMEKVDGGFRVDVPIPYQYTGETTIIVEHNLSGFELKIENNSSEIDMTNSKNYSAVKVKEPKMDKITLYMNSDNVSINTVHYMDVYPKIEIPKNKALSQVPINVYLYRINEEKPIKDSKYYEDLSAELAVTNLNSGEVQKIAMGNTKTGFTATFQNSNPQDYKLQVTVTGENYIQSSVLEAVLFENSLPIQTNENKMNILNDNKPHEVNLDNYFDDVDGDKLIYQITESNENKLNASIDKNKLIVNSEKEGLSNIIVTVSDGRGGILMSAVSIDTMPYWIYYKNHVISIGCLFILVLVLYILMVKKTKKVVPEEPIPPHRPKSIFTTARFEGYFLNTLSGNEIPALNWNASYINNKHSVTLGELLDILDVNEKFTEAYQIYFDAGKNNTVTFYHETDCIVSVGKRDVPRGKKEVLNYDDRIYIIFEDNVSEIEVRYKRIRKKGIR